MHDGMQYDQIQGQGHEPLKVGNLAMFKGYYVLWFHNFCSYGNQYKSINGFVKSFEDF